MYLVQVLLPLQTNNGQPIPQSTFQTVCSELTDKFGGLTAYSRAPAEGLWQADFRPPVRDEIVLLEIMADELNRGWWSSYRKTLEQRFEQESIVVRAQEIISL